MVGKQQPPNHFWARAINIRAVNNSGPATLTAVYNHGNGELVSNKNVTVLNPGSVWITAENEYPCLNNEQLYTAYVSGGCTPDTYKWFINNEEVGGNSRFLNYYFDENEWSAGDSFSVFCRIYCGPEFVNSSPINNGFLIDCSDPLSVIISGDEYICIGDTAQWIGDVLGGSGYYQYQWNLNGDSQSGEYSFHYYFDPAEWTSSQQLIISLRIEDLQTGNFVEATPFISNLDYCYNMNYSLQVNPNPTYDNISVLVQETDNSNTISSGSETVKTYVFPEKDEILTYMLFDSNGRPIYQKITSEKNLVIPISAYSPGLYHLTIISSKGTASKLIIKTW